nr:MAG TPA: hypothetical protein [Caudoviricetes sp.]
MHSIQCNFVDYVYVVPRNKNNVKYIYTTRFL